MITSIIVAAEVVCVIILAVYSLADNERLYASIFAAILAATLSFLVGYQFLFSLIQDGTDPKFGDAPLGWTFIMIGVMIAVLTFAIVVDGILKRRAK